MNILKELTKTIVRAPADILAGTIEALSESLEVVGDAVEGKQEGKKAK